MEMNLMTKKNYCIRCNNDFYNDKNPFGIKECWSFKSAKVVLKKKVSISQAPPWTQEPIEVLDCFRQKGYVYIGS